MKLGISCYKRKELGFQCLWLSIKDSIANSTGAENVAQNNLNINGNCDILYQSKYNTDIASVYNSSKSIFG